MKLTHKCEHGAFTVEFDEGAHGIGNVQPTEGNQSFAAKFIAAAMPRCPYCDAMNEPQWRLAGESFDEGLRRACREAERAGRKAVRS